MRIRVERSGGVAGLSASNEIDVDDLPSSLVAIVRQITENSQVPSSSPKKVPKGAADYYHYKITITARSRKRVLEYDQLNLDDNLKSLIGYVEKNKKVRQ